MEQKYPYLFQPIKIGNVTLRHRIVAAPSSQNDLEFDGTLSKYNIAYYARKARGGAAMVTVGDGIVHPSGQNHPRQVPLYNEAVMHSLMRCAEEIHKYGSIAAFELSHGGMVCDPAYTNDRRPIGPSEHMVSIGFQIDQPVQIMSEEMTESKMIEIAEAFGRAAERVKRAGFDMVMPHGAHGWLISQFLSPHINMRTDDYGGCVENRCRFPIMVLKRIREAVGPNFPINFRINGEDGVENGLSLGESVVICKHLEPYVDSFDVSGSVHYVASTQDIMQSPMFEPRGHMLHYAAAIKQAVNVPVLSVGGHSELEDMEQAVASGATDIISVGRQWLADMDFAKKAESGLEKEIRHCLRCGTCQSSRFKMGATRCAVNPRLGREYELAFLPPVQSKKKVMVVGGGPGGMEAAITASKRGHAVTLYEKSSRLGGALLFAQWVPFKKDLYALVSAMETELTRLGVPIFKNTEVTKELASQKAPDVIVAALGADMICPDLPGVEGCNVILADELRDCVLPAKQVVIVGGGLVGCEAAIHLAQEGKQVTLVEMAEQVAKDANFRHIKTVNRQLAVHSVDVRTRTNCQAINTDGVLVTNPDNKKQLLSADLVVIAVGMHARETGVNELRPCAKEFYAIGNCARAGQVKEAIRGGFDTGLIIGQDVDLF